MMNVRIDSLPAAERVENHLNDKVKSSRLYYAGKLAETILVRPVTTTSTLGFRVVKLLTWVPAKAGLYKVTGNHIESAEYFELEYLRMVKAVRDILYVPSLVKRAYLDMMAKPEQFVDDIPATPYLIVDSIKKFHQFS